MRKQNWLLILSAAVLLGSCEKSVRVDIPQKEPRLVINGLLAKNELFDISIGKSRGILEPDNPGQPVEEQFTVKTAIPVVYENGVAVDTLKYQPATYRYKTILGKTVRDGFIYTIKVTAPGYGIAEAASAAPSQSVIAALTRVRNIRTNSYGETEDEITIKLNDPAGERNFYMIQVWGASAAASPGIRYNSIYCVNTTDKDVDYVGESDDPLDPENCHDASSILMRDDNFNGGVKQLKLFVTSDQLMEFTYPGTMRTYRPFIKLFRITEDEFKYRRSYKVHTTANDNPFAEPVNIFSNVKNGYGVFGLHTVAVDTLR